MTFKETTMLFERMKEVLCMTEMQMAYDAKGWRSCANLWASVFQSEPFDHVWAGVRMYIVQCSGKYWPWPGEIAGCMPASPAVEKDDLCNLTFVTRAQARRDAERWEREHRANSWRC